MALSAGTFPENGGDPKKIPKDKSDWLTFLGSLPYRG
jgi:hypothetical protein